MTDDPIPGRGAGVGLAVLVAALLLGWLAALSLRGLRQRALTELADAEGFARHEPGAALDIELPTDDGRVLRITRAPETRDAPGGITIALPAGGAGIGLRRLDRRGAPRTRLTTDSVQVVCGADWFHGARRAPHVRTLVRDETLTLGLLAAFATLGAAAGIAIARGTWSAPGFVECATAAGAVPCWLWLLVLGDRASPTFVPLAQLLAYGVLCLALGTAAISLPADAIQRALHRWRRR